MEVSECNWVNPNVKYYGVNSLRLGDLQLFSFENYFQVLSTFLKYKSKDFQLIIEYRNKDKAFFKVHHYCKHSKQMFDKQKTNFEEM